MTERQRQIIRDALTETERAAFDAALEAEGLDDEIALLRMLLHRALSETEADPKVVVAGMSALVRAVSAQYRMSPKASQSLAENAAAVLSTLGDLILPADR